LNLKESTSLVVWLHRLLDILIPIANLYLLTHWYSLEWSERYQFLALSGGLLLVTFTQGTGAYTQFRTDNVLPCFRKVIQAWIFTWLALLALTFLMKNTSEFSRVVVTGWMLITPTLLLAYRLLVSVVVSRFRNLGWNSRKIAILGAGSLGQRLAASVYENRALGYEAVGFYDDNLELAGQSINGIPVLGSIEDFLQQSRLEDKFDEIYITLPLRAEKRIKSILNTLANSTVTVKFIPDYFTFDLLHSRITDIGGLPIISIYDSPLNTSTNKLIKRSEDIILSSIFLILALPIFIVIAIGVKLSSKGPVFYQQKRVGWNGEIFNMYKFRSMPVDTENDSLIWGSAKDKINTQFGAFIRKTSLDELPQFFNVLRGDMSIVGPRPEREVFVEKFRKEIPRYMQKHMVKAGITGWAQVHGWRGDTSLKKRIEFDLIYIDDWSLWLDFKIIVMTIFKGFMNKNAY
jgi:putative colanic acid biosysnthesis UDP-glucose lipid carrier transferase